MQIEHLKCELKEATQKGVKSPSKKVCDNEAYRVQRLNIGCLRNNRYQVLNCILGVKMDGRKKPN